MQTQLDINESFIRELIVKENPKYKHKEVSERKTTVSYDIKRENSGLLFMIDMNIQVGHSRKLVETDPYYISMKISGVFMFIKGTDEKTIAKMIHFNGLPILYGVARGIVAQTTANCLYGKYILPTVNFVEIIKKKKARKRPKKIS